MLSLNWIKESGFQPWSCCATRGRSEAESSKIQLDHWCDGLKKHLSASFKNKFDLFHSLVNVRLHKVVAIDIFGALGACSESVQQQVICSKIRALRP